MHSTTRFQDFTTTILLPAPPRRTNNQKHYENFIQ